MNRTKVTVEVTLDERILNTVRIYGPISRQELARRLGYKNAGPLNTAKGIAYCLKRGTIVEDKGMIAMPTEEYYRKHPPVQPPLLPRKTLHDVALDIAIEKEKSVWNSPISENIFLNEIDRMLQDGKWTYPSEVTMDSVQNYAKRMQARGVSKVSISTRITRLRELLGYAVEQRLIDKNVLGRKGCVPKGLEDYFAAKRETRKASRQPRVKLEKRKLGFFRRIIMWLFG